MFRINAASIRKVRRSFNYGNYGKSVTRIELTISDVKGACLMTAPPKPRTISFLNYCWVSLSIFRIQLSGSQPQMFRRLCMLHKNKQMI